MDEQTSNILSYFLFQRPAFVPHNCTLGGEQALEDIQEVGGRRSKGRTNFEQGGAFKSRRMPGMKMPDILSINSWFFFWTKE